MSEEECVARSIDDLHRFLKSMVTPAQLAAVIVEPVIGEGGFIVPPRALLMDVQKICRENGVVLIADEVQTGFGRTGRMFGSEHAGLIPDLVTMAKSLSNGLPLSALVGRADLMDAPQPGGLGGTFGGNPVSCAAALGAIATIEEQGLVSRAERVGHRVGQVFARLVERFEFVGEARGLGAMRALELVKDKRTLEPDKARAERLQAECARRGLMVLTAGLHGNVIRTLMPLSIPDADLDEALHVLEQAAEASA
jgi:4-aminobutyrate aminotransferase/(S)-3-amino-2-methylpropionate transaminase